MAKESALIDSIVDNLKSDRHSQSDVGLIVRWQIEVLKALLAGQPSFGMQAENKEYGSAIEPLVRNVLRKIKGMPEGTRRALLVFSAYSGQPVPRPQNLDFDFIAGYERAVLSALEALQAGSATIKNNKIGDYHTARLAKTLQREAGFTIPMRFIRGCTSGVVALNVIVTSSEERCDAAEVLARRISPARRTRRRIERLQKDAGPLESARDWTADNEDRPETILLPIGRCCLAPRA